MSAEPNGFGETTRETQMFQQQDAIGERVQQPALRKFRDELSQEDREARVASYERQVARHTHGGEIDNPSSILKYRAKPETKQLVENAVKLRRKVLGRKVSHYMVYDVENRYVYKRCKTLSQAIDFVDGFDEKRRQLIETIKKKRGWDDSRIDADAPLRYEFALAEYGVDGRVREILDP
jgi:hypothetical protein